MRKEYIVENNSEESRILQEKLFEAGCSWADGSTDVKAPFKVHNDDHTIYIIVNDKTITWSNLKYGVKI